MIPAKVKQLFDNFTIVATERSFGATFETAKKELLKNLDKALPHLPEVIKTQRYWEPYAGVGSYPICAALEALAEPAPQEVIPILVKLLDSADELKRKVAAMALGEFGSNGCIKPLKKALKDPDEYVVSFAIMGIGKNQDCDREFRAKLFPALVPFLQDTRLSGHAQSAMFTLFALDREKACELLWNPPYFSPDYPKLNQIKDVCKFLEIPIPDEKLDALGKQRNDRLRHQLRADGLTDEQVDERYPGLRLSVNPKTFPELSAWVVHHLGGEEFLSGSIAQLGDDDFLGNENELAELLEQLVKVDDKRVGPFLRQIVDRVTARSFMTVHYALAKGTRTSTLNDKSVSSHWIHGLKIVRLNKEVKAVMPSGTNGKKRPIVARWTFVTEKAAKRMFESLNWLPIKIKSGMPRAPKVIVYFRTVEDWAELQEALRDLRSGPAIEENEDYVDS